MVRERLYFTLSEYTNRFLKDPAQPKLSYIRKLTYNMSLPKSGSTDFATLKRLSALLRKKPAMLRNLVEFSAYTQCFPPKLKWQWVGGVDDEVWAHFDHNGTWDAFVEMFSEVLTCGWHVTKFISGDVGCREVGITFSKPQTHDDVGIKTYRFGRP